MKRTGNLQINDRRYWNEVYGTLEKRAGYAASGTDQAPLQSAQATKRFEYVLKYVKDHQRFLDIGCGVGVMTKLVKDHYPNAEVWGTDISDVAMTTNQAERPDIKYLHQYIGDQFELPDSYFDVVFAGEVLEHLDEPELLFLDAKRVLKQGGTFILTTPNEAEIQSPEHTWFFNHEDIEKLYKDNGFEEPRFEYLPDMEHLMVIFGVGRKL